ncbi:MAG: hypothetical protein WC522_04685 [Candidatus Omnitrophota bacterium]
MITKDTGLYKAMRKRPVQVIINIITVWSFLFSIVGGDLAWAARTPTEPTRVGSNGAGGLGIPLELADITVPLRFGEIKDTFKGTNGKTIIHIQDAHCNYPAQTSISGIIRSLTTTYNNIDLLSLEGGKGNYDLSVFTNIKDVAIREKVSDYFVKEGRVSGPEFFAINNPEKVKLFGIEDEKLYKENLNTYRNSLLYKEEADKHLNTLSAAITNLKLKIYSPQLKELDEKIKGYKDNKVDFKEYIVFLNDKVKAANIDVKAYKTIGTLISVLNDEKNINFKEADRERNKLIDKINEKVSKRDLEGLVIKSTQFKMGDITSEEFYSYLFKKAQFSGVDFSALPNLVKYSEYVKKYEALDKSAIFKEVKNLEGALIGEAAKTEDQKALHSLDKDLAIIKGMMSISLMKDEFDYYTANKDAFRIKRFVDFINTKASLYGFNFKLNNGVEKLDSYRENMEKFYVYSLKRDDAFIKNIEKKLKEEKKDITILVTGGFHTGNLSKLFKDKGYSYIEVMPKFGNADGECPYFRLLAGKGTNFDEFVQKALSPPQSTIAIETLFSEMGIDRNDLNTLVLQEALLEKMLSMRSGERLSFVLKTPRGTIIFHDKPSDPNAPTQQIFGLTVSYSYEKPAKWDLERPDLLLERGGSFLSKKQQDETIDEAGKKAGIERLADGLKRLGLDIKDLRDMLEKKKEDGGLFELTPPQVDLVLGNTGMHNIFMWKRPIVWSTIAAHYGRREIGDVNGDRVLNEPEHTAQNPEYGVLYLNPGLADSSLPKGLRLFQIAVTILHELDGMYSGIQGLSHEDTHIDFSTPVESLKTAARKIAERIKPENRTLLLGDTAMSTSAVPAGDFNSMVSDVRLSGLQDAKTPVQLAEKIIKGEIDPAIAGNRDAFVVIECMLNGNLDQMLAARELREKLSADMDMSKMTGEAIIRWLVRRGVLKPNNSSEVTQRLIGQNAPKAALAGPSEFRAADFSSPKFVELMKDAMLQQKPLYIQTDDGIYQVKLQKGGDEAQAVRQLESDIRSGNLRAYRYFGEKDLSSGAYKPQWITFSLRDSSGFRTEQYDSRSARCGGVKAVTLKPMTVADFNKVATPGLELGMSRALDESIAKLSAAKVAALRMLLEGMRATLATGGFIAALREIGDQKKEYVRVLGNDSELQKTLVAVLKNIFIKTNTSLLDVKYFADFNGFYSKLPERETLADLDPAVGAAAVDLFIAMIGRSIKGADTTGAMTAWQAIEEASKVIKSGVERFVVSSKVELTLDQIRDGIYTNKQFLGEAFWKMVTDYNLENFKEGKKDYIKELITSAVQNAVLPAARSDHAGAGWQFNLSGFDAAGNPQNLISRMSTITLTAVNSQDNKRFEIRFSPQSRSAAEKAYYELQLSAREKDVRFEGYYETKVETPLSLEQQRANVQRVIDNMIAKAGKVEMAGGVTRVEVATTARDTAMQMPPADVHGQVKAIIAAISNYTPITNDYEAYFEALKKVPIGYLKQDWFIQILAEKIWEMARKDLKDRATIGEIASRVNYLVAVYFMVATNAKFTVYPNDQKRDYSIEEARISGRGYYYVQKYLIQDSPSMQKDIGIFTNWQGLPSVFSSDKLKTEKHTSADPRWGEVEVSYLTDLNDAAANLDALANRIRVLLGQAVTTVRDTAMQMPVAGVQSQDTLKMMIAASSPASYGFVKDAPILGYRITSDRFEDLPEQIRSRIGAVDQTKYTPEYLRANMGSIIALQVKDDGTADFYIVGKDTFDKKYKLVAASEVGTKNKKLFGKVTAIEGMKALVESGNANIVGALKTVPVQMTKMSEIGYATGAEAVIQSPWGEQTKPAGQDAYLVFDEGQDMYYMVNSDTNGLPISYVPLTVRDTAMQMPVAGVQSQDTLKMMIAASSPASYGFVKDAPILGYRITSDRFEDLPEQIRSRIGAVDQTKYTPEYLRANMGSIIALQVKDDGTADFYIVGKDTFDKKYKLVAASEVGTKNKKLFGKVTAIEGMKALVESGNANIVGALKTVPVQMTKMSEIGYATGAEAVIQSPWGEQTKPAGQDAYLVFDEGQDMYYMVNSDTNGLPISYVPLTVRDTAMQMPVAGVIGIDYAGISNALAEALQNTNAGWQPLSATAKSDETMRDIFKLYVSSYQGIGLPFSNDEQGFGKFKTWYDQVFVNYDSSGKIVAFIMAWAEGNPYGMKLGLIGSDGSKEGKARVKDALSTMFHVNGVYGELSHRPEEIALGLTEALLQERVYGSVQNNRELGAAEALASGSPIINPRLGSLLSGKDAEVDIDGVHLIRKLTINGRSEPKKKLIVGNPIVDKGVADNVGGLHVSIGDAFLVGWHYNDIIEKFFRGRLRESEVHKYFMDLIKEKADGGPLSSKPSLTTWSPANSKNLITNSNLREKFFEDWRQQALKMLLIGETMRISIKRSALGRPLIEDIALTQQALDNFENIGKQLINTPIGNQAKMLLQASSEARAYASTFNIDKAMSIEEEKGYYDNQVLPRMEEIVRTNDNAKDLLFDAYTHILRRFIEGNKLDWANEYLEKAKRRAEELRYDETHPLRQTLKALETYYLLVKSWQGGAEGAAANSRLHSIITEDFLNTLAGRTYMRYLWLMGLDIYVQDLWGRSNFNIEGETLQKSQYSMGQALEWLDNALLNGGLKAEQMDDDDLLSVFHVFTAYFDMRALTGKSYGELDERLLSLTPRLVELARDYEATNGTVIAVSNLNAMYAYGYHMQAVVERSEEAYREAEKYYRQAYDTSKKAPQKVRQLLLQVQLNIDFALAIGDRKYLATAQALLGELQKTHPDYEALGDIRLTKKAAIFKEMIAALPVARDTAMQMPAVPMATFMITPIAPSGSSAVFDASRLTKALTIDDLKAWLAQLKSDGSELDRAVYPDFLQGEPAIFNIGVTEWEWNNIKTSLYGPKAAAGAYFMKHKLGKVTINFFVNNKEGIAHIEGEMSSLSPEDRGRTVTFAYTGIGRDGAPLLIDGLEKNCLKVVYLNGKDGEVATPVQGCFQQGIRILNHAYLLSNKSTLPDQLLESAMGVSKGMAALAGVDATPEDIKELAKKIIEQGLVSVLLFAKLRPVDVNAIAAFHKAEAEVLRAL